MGPWRGEVGFETLYWIPFLHAFREVFQIDPERLIPITRGGMGELYGVPKYLELYAMRSPKDLRLENKLQHAKTKMLKQMTVTKWDRAVLNDAAATLKLSKYHVLHPAWMYQALSPFWDGHKGAQWVLPQLRYPAFPVRDLPAGLTLPEKFVAVKFYARPTLPPNQLTANLARETIKTLASHTPVVILNANLHADDHFDFTFKEPMSNVKTLSDLVHVTPENNLALQAQVLSRSMGFVGTYGGVAQLALCLQKPSVSFYTDWGGTLWPHKHLSEMIGAWKGVSFQVHRIGDMPMLQSALPRFTIG